MVASAPNPKKYRNPVLHADYSDPDVIRVESEYYLTSSSFHCFPGLPILHSRNLVNWRILGHALPRMPLAKYDTVQPGEGVWAPTLRFHDGRFWIFFPTPEKGIFVITAERPEGPWSGPHLLLGGRGLIDPCPWWEGDRAWLLHAYAFSRSGKRDLLQLCPMSPDGKKTLGEGKALIHAPHHPYLEGPKVYRRGEWLYIFAPGGGVPQGWQVVYRGKSIEGPFEERVVLAQKGTSINGPHQGALVEDTAGGWWFLHFQDKDLYGRVVHLQPVRWQDGWPLIGEAVDGQGCGQPVESHELPPGDSLGGIVPQMGDDYRNGTLSPAWQWPAHPPAGGWSVDSSRRLRLEAAPLPPEGLSCYPRLLLQKFPAENFEVRVSAEARGEGVRAGIVVAGAEMGYLARVREGGVEKIEYLGKSGICFREAIPAEASLVLRVSHGGRCSFGYSSGQDDFYQIGPVFPVRQGNWIGAKFGLVCFQETGFKGGYGLFSAVEVKGT
jgi:beta-xylosidase